MLPPEFAKRRRPATAARHHERQLPHQPEISGVMRITS